MRIRSRQVLWSLSASLAAVALLSGCSANDLGSGKTSTSRTSTMAVAVPTTTAVAAPITGQGPRTEKWVDLKVGDCLADLPPTDLSVVTVTIVDCATAHKAEVYLRAPIGIDATVDDVANRECVGGFSQYTGRSIDGSTFAVTYLIDAAQDRTSSNPAPSTVICFLQAANGRPLTEPARR